MNAPKYYAYEFACDRWKIMTPSGGVLYDDAPDGRDEQVVFADEDAARDCAERLNTQGEGEDEP